MGCVLTRLWWVPLVWGFCVPFIVGVGVGLAYLARSVRLYGDARQAFAHAHSILAEAETIRERALKMSEGALLLYRAASGEAGGSVQ